MQIIVAVMRIRSWLIVELKENDFFCFSEASLLSFFCEKVKLADTMSIGT